MKLIIFHIWLFDNRLSETKTWIDSKIDTFIVVPQLRSHQLEIEYPFTKSVLTCLHIVYNSHFP